MKQDQQGNLRAATKKKMAFILSRFSTWKDALECFLYHESSECHKISATYGVLVPKCGNIQEIISETTKTEMALNRKYLIKIIDCLQFLGRQGIAIQESTEEESFFFF